jgi:heme/copper-type cytochrome/quinol oxidase subunit 3
MEIPYTVRPRPDTGLANPKLGIWLFLASEVMLFGGLFAGYIFMRMGAEPWMWPKGWLNVPVGTFNTFVLILSSVTVILSWESLKLRNFKAYKFWLMVTWVCGLLFLTIKLAYEWPAKFHHLGAYVQKTAEHKYEALLGNEDRQVGEETVLGHVKRKAKNYPVEHPNGFPRMFIGGYLYTEGDPKALKSASVPYVSKDKLDAVLALGKDEQDPKKKAKLLMTRETMLKEIVVRESDLALLRDPAVTDKTKTEVLTRMNTIYLYKVDPENAKPYDPDNDKAHFLPRSLEKVAKLGLKDHPLVRPLVDPSTGKTKVDKDGDEIHQFVLDKKDLVAGHGPLVPKLNTYLATYFMITGLHGAHVLAGCICFIYFWLPIAGGSKLFYTNPEQLCNRIEVSGLFWHLVDLVWIFVFPIFYLL